MRNKLLFILTLFISIGSTPSWGSTLSDVANSMQPGTWAQLNTNGFNTNYLLYPNGPNTNITTQFMGEGTWDPITKKVLFLGAGHYNYSQLHVYSESTNAWTRGTNPPGAPIGFGHGYNHNALSVSNRILGFIQVQPTEIRFKQYNIGANIWTEKSSTPNDGEIAHALVYFPERSKWYVADGTFGKIREFDHASDSWSTYSWNEECFGGKSRYHQFASYNPVRKEIVFGGGNGSSGVNVFSKTWCKMDQSGDITLMPLAPHSLRVPEGGNNQDGALITIDPVSGDMLVLTQDGKFYAFNFSTNAWTTINDQSTRPSGLTHSSNNVTNGFVIPISTYGVVMYADYNGNNSSIWLYKHAQGGTVVSPPTEDTISPSTPTGFGGSPTSETTVTLSWQASNDNVGVAGYQILRDGNVVANPSSTTYTDTALQAATAYSYKVQAFDSAGNFSTASSAVNITTSAGSTPPPPPPPPGNTTANTITIFNTSGNTQTNRPVSIARPFRKGEINDYAQAKVNGTAVLTQCDVKNRWNDGSLKYAIVSFVIPSLSSSGSADVEFVNQNTGNNTGFLNQAQMLASGYNFDASIQMSGSTSRTVSARTMLENGKFRYWLKGPIVTAAIIEDRTPARSYDQDFGDGGKALHPIFESWFYPQGNNVKVGYTVENIWASNDASKSMRDLSYSITLKAGEANPATKWTHPSFNHTGQSRWHKTFWVGSDPGSLRIDHNLKYLVTTGSIPHYNTALTVDSTPEGGRYNTYQQYNGTLDGRDGGDTTKMGNYKKALNGAGQSDWIGLQKTWEVLWLYSMSERGWEMVVGNADLAGRLPIHLREADSLAGSGDYFDQTWSRTSNLTSQGSNLGTGTVETFGRVVSINARPTSTFSGLFDSGNSTDKIRRGGTVTTDGWSQTDSSHHSDACYTAYLFTGRYYYLECLQMEANFRVGWKLSGWNSNFGRPGNEGLLNNTNIRTDAWGTKVLVYAAFISPDGEPEQAYFIDKLENNVTAWEGVQNLPITYSSKQQIWNWGRNIRTTNLYWAFPGKQPSPLGQWSTGVSAFIQSPLNNNGSLSHATSPWEENFMLAVLGMARQMEVAETSKLLTFMARKRFHLNLDNSPSNLHNFIEAYRDPTIQTSTGQWIPDFNTFVSHYLTSVEPYTKRRDGLTTDHSYAFIALAADSFLIPYTVDGLSGQASWTANKNDTPHQGRFETDSPKWAITPMGQGSTQPPSDAIPPSSPQNLTISN